MIHSSRVASASFNSILNQFNWTKFGVDFYGGVLHDNGMGDIARVIYKSLNDNNIPNTVTPFKGTFKFKSPNHYPINIILGGAESAISVVSHHHIKSCEYTIGVWFWELEDYFPWTDAYDFVDEVWCFSQFCKDIFIKYDHKGIPIHKFAYAPETNMIDGCSIHKLHSMYNIDPHKYTFLYSFDYFGSIDRKNPYAAVDAFVNAFGDRNDVQFVVKSMFGNIFPLEEAAFKYYISKFKNIKYIDGLLTKGEFLGLIKCCDCYISLHRSEGLGIGMMEAMYLWKPVIATAYGGSMEFTDHSCTLLVDYEMVPTMTNQCCYGYNATWAEPNVNTAADYMRMLVSDRCCGIEIGKKAQEHVRSNYNQSIINKQINNRINWIWNSLTIK